MSTHAASPSGQADLARKVGTSRSAARRLTELWRWAFVRRSIASCTTCLDERIELLAIAGLKILRSAPEAEGGLKIREVIRLLERDGWILTRQRGSHRQYKHAHKPGLVTVAGKPGADLAPGTLNSILKQARLKP